MKFDATISLGVIIQAFVLIVTGLGVTSRWAIQQAKTTDALARTEKVTSDIQTDMKQVQQQITEMRMIQTRLADGKERMDDHEARIRICEHYLAATPKPLT